MNTGKNQEAVSKYTQYKFSHRKLEKIVAMVLGNHQSVMTLERLPGASKELRMRFTRNDNGTITIDTI